MSNIISLHIRTAPRNPISFTSGITNMICRQGDNSYPWSHELWPKNALSQCPVFSQRPLSQSATSVSQCQGYNEILEAVHRSCIYLTAEGYQETVNECCENSHHLKWGPFSLNEVGRITQEGIVVAIVKWILDLLQQLSNIIAKFPYF